MRFQTIALSLLAAATSVAAAEALERRSPHVHPGPALLEKRQEQFVPNTTTAEGSTCADAFGNGYQTCREGSDTQNRLCYDPTAGQTCCQSSWACPAASFCSVTGSCCPNGTDVSACAQASTSLASTASPTAGSGSGSGSGSSGSGSLNSEPTGSSGSAAASPTPNDAADSWRSKGANVGFAGLILGAVIML